MSVLSSGFGLAPQVLPTQLIPDEKEGKVLRVRFIQKEGVDFFKPTYLFDEGSTISWIPCGRKLTCSFPGIKFFYGPDTYFGEEVRKASSRSALALVALPPAVSAQRALLHLQQGQEHPNLLFAPFALHIVRTIIPENGANMDSLLHVYRCLFWRWMASLTKSRSSSMWRAT